MCCKILWQLLPMASVRDSSGSLLGGHKVYLPIAAQKLQANSPTLLFATQTKKQRHAQNKKLV
jgi:hypothetical protein